MTHRTKTYLSNAVLKFVWGLKPADMHLSPDFEIIHRHLDDHWAQISIKDPCESAPRYFEVRITEKL